MCEYTHHTHTHTHTHTHIMLSACIIEDNVKVSRLIETKVEEAAQILGVHIPVLDTLTNYVERKYNIVSTGKLLEHAIEFIPQSKATLYFLDLQLDMPEDGESILQTFPELMRETIIITGHFDLALGIQRRYNVPVVMKDVNSGQLAWELRKLPSVQKEIAMRESPETEVEWIELPSNKRLRRFALHRIEHFSPTYGSLIVHYKTDDYQKLFQSKYTLPFVEITIEQLMKRLPEYFIQIHKSHIINALHVHSVLKPNEKRDLKLLMLSGVTYNIARDRKDEVFECLARHNPKSLL